MGAAPSCPRRPWISRRSGPASPPGWPCAPASASTCCSPTARPRPWPSTRWCGRWTSAAPRSSSRMRRRRSSSGSPASSPHCSRNPAETSPRLTAWRGPTTMNGGSVTPTRMRDPDKPQQIIEAAVRVFARKGYYNSRVSDAAREAGIAAGTIYLYFKTKDDILVSLFREKMAHFVDVVRKAIADEADAASKVRRLVRLHFSLLEEDSDLAEVLQVELRQGQKFFRGASSQEIGAYFALIAAVLAEGVSAGRFRSGLPVKLATKMLFGAMDQMATSWVLGKRGYRLVDTAEAVAEIFLQGVAAATP